MESPEERVVQARERLERIKRDPARALFSNFEGVSPSGAATVWVDMLGRLKRIHVKPNSLYEGGEPWLIEEIMSAYAAAQKSADFLDFDVAEFAEELKEVVGLGDQNVATRNAARVDDEWSSEEGVLR